VTARRRRDKRWFFRRVVRLPNGKRARLFGIPATYGLPNTKIGAETAEARAVALALSTGRTKPGPVEPSSSPTLESSVEPFLESSRAKNKHSSLESKRQILAGHIVPALGYLPLDRVDYAAIEDFKLGLLKATATRPALSPKTVNNILTVLRRLLAVAAKRGTIAGVPEIEWLHVERPDFDFLTFDECDRLLAAAGDWSAMITLAARTGMRQGELLGLRWDDVDLRAGRITVRQAIVRGRVTTPKNRKAREIPLAPSAAAALQAQRHLRGPLVWCDPDGKPLTKGECKHPLWSSCKRAGLRRIGWHVLRHTFASHLAMRGVPLRTIQELMGHATIAMTLRYAHLAPEVTRDAVTLLDGVAPGATAQQTRTDSGRRRPNGRSK
jgi:integrase